MIHIGDTEQNQWNLRWRQLALIHPNEDNSPITIALFDTSCSVRWYELKFN